MNRQDFHSRIMNIQAQTPGRQPAFDMAYKIGHRDARHAAAEIANEADDVIDELCEALDFAEKQYRRFASAHGTDDCEAYIRIKDALAKARGED